MGLNLLKLCSHPNVRISYNNGCNSVTVWEFAVTYDSNQISQLIRLIVFKLSFLYLLEQSLKVGNILHILSGHGFRMSKYEELGLYLNVELNIIDGIEKDCQSVLSRLSHVLQHWLNNDPEASWSKLANALQSCNCRNLANIIRNRQTGNYCQCRV